MQAPQVILNAVASAPITNQLKQSTTVRITNKDKPPTPKKKIEPLTQEQIKKIASHRLESMQLTIDPERMKQIEEQMQRKHRRVSVSSLLEKSASDQLQSSRGSLQPLPSPSSLLDRISSFDQQIKQPAISPPRPRRNFLKVEPGGGPFDASIIHQNTKDNYNSHLNSLKCDQKVEDIVMVDRFGHIIEKPKEVEADTKAKRSPKQVHKAVHKTEKAEVNANLAEQKAQQLETKADLVQNQKAASENEKHNGKTILKLAKPGAQQQPQQEQQCVPIKPPEPHHAHHQKLHLDNGGIKFLSDSPKPVIKPVIDSFNASKVTKKYHEEKQKGFNNYLKKQSKTPTILNSQNSNQTTASTADKPGSEFKLHDDDFKDEEIEQNLAELEFRKASFEENLQQMRLIRAQLEMRSEIEKQFKMQEELERTQSEAERKVMSTLLRDSYYRASQVQQNQRRKMYSK